MQCKVFFNQSAILQTYQYIPVLLIAGHKKYFTLQFNNVCLVRNDEIFTVFLENYYTGFLYHSRSS